MSVVKSKQKEGKLVVVTKARELAQYTLQICGNEKNFPKRYRWCLTSKIVDSAMNIMNSVNMANSVFVPDDARIAADDLKARRQYQTRALAETYALIGMIDLSYKLYGLEASRVEHWARQVYNVQNLVRNWRKSDYDRYKNIIGQ